MKVIYVAKVSGMCAPCKTARNILLVLSLLWSCKLHNHIRAELCQSQLALLISLSTWHVIRHLEPELIPAPGAVQYHVRTDL